MTSSKHMNGYFLEQEALGGRGGSAGIPKFLYVLVSPLNTILSESSNTHILLES